MALPGVSPEWPQAQNAGLPRSVQRSPIMVIFGFIFGALSIMAMVGFIYAWCLSVASLLRYGRLKWQLSTIERTGHPAPMVDPDQLRRELWVQVRQVFIRGALGAGCIGLGILFIKLRLWAIG